ncbi:class II fructose-bisphosphatase [Roseospira visakhapatnamensis]|uniref:Fructose-1,6-bisphosphatase n=1 Tax=Roseospira visakhapatnamensis TaxID=390880 RepID=A0A7W6REY7_9PROT|nr:class II fructose-bisphosphatase [Roseospira visakhapatnamensis]MBB4266836.1 fructose-1,6-bisphosphatase II [Roseospira visakhapatnamensis]
MMSMTGGSAPLFLYALRSVTEAAASAAYDWIGRGRKEDGDGAAVDAMRAQLNQLAIDGVVVIGEGEKDEAPALYSGERLGQAPDDMQLDIAVDPVEGTSYLANGMTNALAVIAVAPRGTMMDPGPAFYMEKLVVPPAARGKIDPTWSVERRLTALAQVLDKPIGELTVYVLEKPRHRGLVERIHQAGARVALYPAGDVAGALMAAIPESGIDCLMGTGGTPEGIMSACAVRALGGEFMGRLDPQLPTEQIAVQKAGLNTERWYAMDQMIKSQKVFFCATGITSGLLVGGVQRTSTHERLETLMVSGDSGERQTLVNWRPLGHGNQG